MFEDSAGHGRAAPWYSIALRSILVLTLAVFGRSRALYGVPPTYCINLTGASCRYEGQIWSRTFPADSVVIANRLPSANCSVEESSDILTPRFVAAGPRECSLNKEHRPVRRLRKQQHSVSNKLSPHRSSETWLKPALF